jgi:hypothetical protein
MRVVERMKGRKCSGAVGDRREKNTRVVQGEVSIVVQNARLNVYRLPESRDRLLAKSRGLTSPVTGAQETKCLCWEVDISMHYPSNVNKLQQ